MIFWKTKIFVLLALSICVLAEKEDDTATAFMEAAQTLFRNKDAIGDLGNVARAFMQPDAGKEKSDGLGQIMSGLGSLMNNQNNQASGGGGGGGGGVDLSMIGDIIGGLSSLAGNNNNRRARPHKHRDDEDDDDNESSGFDFESVLNIASAFMGQSGNAEGMMGLLPLVLNTFGGSSTDKHGRSDHSDHSWYMPPILENAHLMWEHFRNSELGQTVWKNSGLANIVGTMTDENGRIEWERIMESFENPSQRRRWISSLTNYVAEWMSHLSDPGTQQRYLSTAQFVGNSFLKSQGYPKTVMFDPAKPVDSLSRLANAVAKRHLHMKINSILYIRPAIAYIQELMNLASEKGFIMSRINARELSNKLSELINNGFIGPLLKAYRGYKWGSKMPHCAAQILCSINHKSTPMEGKVNNESIRRSLTKMASFPAAWGISNNSGLGFWSLYAAILDTDNDCLEKYPADCTLFHDEEIRVTTEATHTEL